MAGARDLCSYDDDEDTGVRGADGALAYDGDDIEDDYEDFEDYNTIDGADDGCKYAYHDNL